MIDLPLRVLYTVTAVVLGLVHVLVPFMVISVWAALQRLNPHLTLAAASLGANPFTTFRRVILPLVLPGILSGSLIVFALAASSFATPAILGGRRLKVVATAMYDEFLGEVELADGRCAGGLSVRSEYRHHAFLQPSARTPLREAFDMKRNGPLAIIFHTIFVMFILAPLVMVVVISFTPEAYLSFPTNGLSLRWF